MSLFGAEEIDKEKLNRIQKKVDISKYLDVLGIMLEESSYFEKLSGTFQYKGEVIYTIRNEYAQSLIDFLRRRTTILLGNQCSKGTVKEVLELFKKELNWDSAREAEELASLGKEVEKLGLRNLSTSF